MSENKHILPGVTFTGPVTVNGPMFDIHNNDHVHINGLPMAEQGVPDETPPTTTSDMPSKEQRIYRAICIMREEGVLKHLYDYAWVMAVMNETEGLPHFSSPASFHTYMANDVGVERLPDESQLRKESNSYSGQFPQWKFIKADTTEGNRRINVAKRFLNLMMKTT